MTVVFESPDGGKTIYKRIAGSTERELIQKDNMLSSYALWRKICQSAKSKPVLQSALDRVIVTYYTSKDYEDRYGGKNSKA